MQMHKWNNFCMSEQFSLMFIDHKFSSLRQCKINDSVNELHQWSQYTDINLNLIQYLMQSFLSSFEKVVFPTF